MVGIAVERVALGNISRNLDFFQALAVAQPLLSRNRSAATVCSNCRW